MRPTDGSTAPSGRRPTTPTPSPTVHLRRAAAPPPMPPTVHTDAEVRALAGGSAGAHDEVWVAEADGARRRLCAVDARAGSTTSTSLPDRARPGRRLGACSTWPSAAARTASACGSSRATRRPARSTPGTGWSSSSTPTGRPTRSGRPTSGWRGPAATRSRFLRGLIDDVDARSSATCSPGGPRSTAAVQAHKHGRPSATRSASARSRRAMAARAPALGEERLTRIVHAIITESLDAAGH